MLHWFLYPSLLPFGEGFTLPPTPFPDPGRGRLEYFAGSWSDFLAILVAFFFSSLFRCLLGSIFARFSTPTCLPKSTKIIQKSMPRCIPSWVASFDRFLIDCCSQLPPPEPQKSLKLYGFYNVFKKVGLSSLTSLLHPILVPTCFHFGSQNPLKSEKIPFQETSKK